MKRLLFLLLTINIYGEDVGKPPRSLKVLYQSKAGGLFRPLLNSGLVNRLAGAYMDTRFSRIHIKSFVKKNNIDLSESEKTLKEFESFNDFFYRKLKLGSRCISAAINAIVSPADSKLFVIPNISQADTFFIKSKSFNLKEFLGDKTLASEYEGGSLLIFRLAPPDYHRYHFPIDCIPSEVVRIKGVYDSVNPVVYKSGRQPLITNERHLTILTGSMNVAMISVGALCVGKIVETYQPLERYKKGDDMGYFAFGGSTIVLLFKKDEVLIYREFIENSSKGFETVVKMGEVVAK